MGRKEKEIWAEMARRKVRFHKNEKWQDIKLWGLFRWSYIKGLLDKGEPITDMKKENVRIWVRPSEKAYKEKIEPLLKYDLDELTIMAGW